MIFTIEHNGEVSCRLMCNDIRGSLAQFNEIPYSKFLGFICEHIFETLRLIDKHENFINETMETIFKKYPIKFGITYKNNSEFGQGVSMDIRDCNWHYKSKESNKNIQPSSLTRGFNKQIVVAFHFITKPAWFDDFVKVWKNRGIDLKGASNTIKNVVESIDDINFKYDDNISYYTYKGFKRSETIEITSSKMPLETTLLNPNKMLFMFNSHDPKKSVYIENLEQIHISSFECQDVFKEIEFITIGD